MRYVYLESSAPIVAGFHLETLTAWQSSTGFDLELALANPPDLSLGIVLLWSYRAVLALRFGRRVLDGLALHIAFGKFIYI